MMNKKLVTKEALMFKKTQQKKEKEQEQIKWQKSVIREEYLSNK